MKIKIYDTIIELNDLIDEDSIYDFNSESIEGSILIRNKNPFFIRVYILNNEKTICAMGYVLSGISKTQLFEGYCFHGLCALDKNITYMWKDNELL